MGYSPKNLKFQDSMRKGSAHRQSAKNRPTMASSPLQEPRMNTPLSTPDTTPGVVSIKSAHNLADTLERLRETFKAHGIKVFTTIDHGAEAAAVGLVMPPTVLLIFGNAKA